MANNPVVSFRMTKEELDFLTRKKEVPSAQLRKELHRLMTLFAWAQEDKDMTLVEAIKLIQEL